MPRSHGLLRIHAAGAGPVRDAVATLQAVENAYLQLYAINLHFEAIGDLFTDKRPHLRPPWFEFGGPSWATYNRDSDSPEEIRRRLVIADDELQLSAIRFESPGFWEFLGALNPLEQIRKYLNDRHERTKDRDYRNAAERIRLNLENEKLAIETMGDRVDFLRKIGYTDEDIRRLMLPAAGALGQLGGAQDRGLIEVAESQPAKPQKGKPDGDET